MSDGQVVQAVAPVLSFFADEEDKTFKTLPELVTHLQGESYRTEAIDRSAFPNVKFDKDADNRVTLDWGNGPIQMQNTGFTRLCKLLKAPENFLNQLPLDNIRRDVVARLMSSEDLSRITAIIKNNRIVGVSKKEAPLSALSLLQNSQIFTTNHKTFQSCGVTNGRVMIDYTVTDNQPLPNDSFGFGISMVHDDTMGTYPSIAPYSFRMVCANGLVHTRTFGNVRFSNRMSNDKFMESFSAKATELPTQMFAEYASVLSTMQNKSIEGEEKPIIRDFLSDTLNWESGIDGSTTYEAEIARKGTATYYDLMNFTTNYANQLDLRSRRTTQMLGAEMFDFFKGDQGELFKGYAEHHRKHVYAHS
jgi:hypothetical protein